MDHAQIGGRLLARWKFPAQLVGAIWFNHCPAAAGPHRRLAAYVYVGNMTAYFVGHGYGCQAFAMRGREEAFEILGLRSDVLPHYMLETVEQFHVVEAFIHLAA